MSTKSDWVWMPHAGHFICGHDCRFHLTTYVYGVIVSTVGELYSDSIVRKLMSIEENKPELIGCDRLYETMVFKAVKSKEGCCPWIAVDGNNLDFEGYNDAKSAYERHLRMCEKWDKG